MSFQSMLTILAVSSSLILGASLNAQESTATTVKITNPKLASINMGLDSSDYWLEKMKEGDSRRGSALLSDLEKLATRFNRVPKSDGEQYKYIVNRFASLSMAIKEKSGQTAPKAASKIQSQPENTGPGKPHRNLFTLNKQLDSIQETLNSFDAANQNSIKRLQSQLENANRIFRGIPESTHPEFVSTKQRMSVITAQCRKVVPRWESDQDPMAFLTDMRTKYLKQLELPRAQKLMKNRELTDEDVKFFLGSISAFNANIEQDLPRIKAAATSTGTASDLVSWIDKESFEFIKKESDKLRSRLDATIETALSDAKHLAGLDPNKNRYTFVTDSVRKNNEAKFARAFRTMENAKSIEEAFNVPGRWSSKRDDLERLIAVYREKAAQATKVNELPMDVGDKELAKIASQTLSNKKYGVGKIERIIVNSKNVPRDRIQTRLFNKTLETTVRKWEEFQVCTVEIEEGKFVVYFNTLKKFSQGPDTTPINQWILSNRFKSGEISRENLN